jgi:hypothetical protein
MNRSSPGVSLIAIICERCVIVGRVPTRWCERFPRVRRALPDRRGHLLLFIAYLLWGTAWQASNAQHSLSDQLNQERAHHDGSSNTTDPSPDALHLVTGQPCAFIRIPAFGKSWKFTIVHGTALAQVGVGG